MGQVGVVSPGPEVFLVTTVSVFGQAFHGFAGNFVPIIVHFIEKGVDVHSVVKTILRSFSVTFFVTTE